MFVKQMQSSSVVLVLVLVALCGVSARSGHSLTSLNQRIADEIIKEQRRVKPEEVVAMVSVLGRLSKGCFVASFDKSDEAQVQCYRRAVNS